MAQVDFSNATLIPLLSGAVTPIRREYMGLYKSTGNMTCCNSSGASIASGFNANKLVDTKDAVVIAYTGTFTASGTELYIKHGTGSADAKFWKVENISFQSGDTFSFSVKEHLA